MYLMIVSISTVCENIQIKSIKLNFKVSWKNTLFYYPKKREVFSFYR